MELTLETIRAAHARIAPYIVRTPLLRLPALEMPLAARCMPRLSVCSARAHSSCAAR